MSSLYYILSRTQYIRTGTVSNITIVVMSRVMIHMMIQHPEGYNILPIDYRLIHSSFHDNGHHYDRAFVIA
jgi:hypothetical protein